MATALRKVTVTLGAMASPHIFAKRTLFLDENEEELAQLDCVIWPHIGAMIDFGQAQRQMVVTDVRLNAPFVDGAEAWVTVIVSDAEPPDDLTDLV